MMNNESKVPFFTKEPTLKIKSPTLKQTRSEKGRVTRKRHQDTQSRMPPQTPMPLLLGLALSSSMELVFCMALSSLPPLTILTAEFRFTSPLSP